MWASTRCERVSPPIGNCAKLAPRSRYFATQPIALEKLTPNRCAAARQLMPSSRTAETTCLRMYYRWGPHPAPPPISAHPRIDISSALAIWPLGATWPETALVREPLNLPVVGAIVVEVAESFLFGARFSGGDKTGDSADQEDSEAMGRHCRFFQS